MTGRALHHFRFHRGKTWSITLRWEREEIVYRPIEGVEEVAPLVLTVPAHGLVTGWRVAITGVRGMTELNAGSAPPAETDYRPVRVIDANTVEINEVNAATYRPWRGGGYLQYRRPVELAGHDVRMVVKAAPRGEEHARWSSDTGHVMIDAPGNAIVIVVPAHETEWFAWDEGVYEIEVESLEGKVSRLLCGNLTVCDEIATPARDAGSDF